MDEGKIRYAKQTLEQVIPVEVNNQVETVKDFKLALEIAIELMEAYLNCKGFPEKKNEVEYPFGIKTGVPLHKNIGFNQAVEQFKLASLKAPSVSEEEVLRAIWLWNTEKHSKHTQITLHQSKELAKVIKELIKKGVGDV